MAIEIIERMISSFKKLLLTELTPLRYYKLAIGTFFACFPVAMIMEGLNVDKIILLIHLSGTFFVVGFSWEAYTYIKQLSKKAWASSIITGLFFGAISTTIASIYAEHIINSATHLNPSYYPNSKIFIATFTLPIIWLYISTIGILLFSIFFMFFLWVKEARTSLNNRIRKSKTESQLPIDSLRLLASFVLGAYLIAIISHVPSFTESAPKSITKAIVALSDHYQYGPCTNVQDDEGYRNIGDNRISVVSFGKALPDVSFEERICITNADNKEPLKGSSHFN